MTKWFSAANNTVTKWKGFDVFQNSSKKHIRFKFKKYKLFFNNFADYFKQNVQFKIEFMLCNYINDELFIHTRSLNQFLHILKAAWNCLFIDRVLLSRNKSSKQSKLSTNNVMKHFQIYSRPHHSHHLSRCTFCSVQIVFNQIHLKQNSFEKSKYTDLRKAYCWIVYHDINVTLSHGLILIQALFMYKNHSLFLFSSFCTLQIWLGLILLERGFTFLDFTVIFRLGPPRASTTCRPPSAQWNKILCSITITTFT